MINFLSPQAIDVGRLWSNATGNSIYNYNCLYWNYELIRDNSWFEQLVNWYRHSTTNRGDVHFIVDECGVNVCKIYLLLHVITHIHNSNPDSTSRTTTARTNAFNINQHDLIKRIIWNRNKYTRARLQNVFSIFICSLCGVKRSKISNVFDLALSALFPFRKRIFLFHILVGGIGDEKGSLSFRLFCAGT